MDRCRDDEEESGKDRSKQQRERDTCDTDTCAEVVHHHHADRSSDDEKDFNGDGERMCKWEAENLKLIWGWIRYGDSLQSAGQLNI